MSTELFRVEIVNREPPNSIVWILARSFQHLCEYVEQQYGTTTFLFERGTDAPPDHIVLDITDQVVPQVFAMHGVEPEVLAYAMAKYSRSALSMKDSIAEISSQKASEFLNTFYFQYGHKSIADMAHIPMAIESVSLLAAIEVVDEQRWDGQERSTRYQDFSKRLYYTPKGMDDVQSALYHKTILGLFDAYDVVFQLAYEQFKKEHPRPEDLTEATYERTLKARSFDVARYLLPMATLTSVGQITSARTLEGQINRMLTSPYVEVQDLGGNMRDAATTQPVYTMPEEAAGVRRFAAPTLVKHTGANQFQRKVRDYVKNALCRIDLRIPPVHPVKETPLVEVTASGLSADEEIIATLIYEHSNLPFSNICEGVQRTTSVFREGFMADVLALRGEHDELPRSFRAQGGVIFDIYMDIGGMRDLHRHRRATQIIQAYTADDFAYPEPSSPDVRQAYREAVGEAKQAYDFMTYLHERNGHPPADRAYLLPLGAKCRFLMKMDVAEIAYIAELRTGPAGHISYRRVAWEMFKALQAVSPQLAAGIAHRVTHPDNPLDFFKR